MKKFNLFQKIIWLFTFIYLIPFTGASEYTILLDISDDKGVDTLEFFLEDPSGNIQSFILYNSSISQRIETDLHFDQKIFVDKNGLYKYWEVATDLSGNQNPIQKKTFENYDIHESVKNKFILDFNFTIWDFYITFDNPKKQRELNFEMIFPLPILDSSVKFNDREALESPYYDTEINRIYRIKDKLNVGENTVHFYLEIPKETIVPRGNNELKFLNVLTLNSKQFHKFPLDEYIFNQSTHTIKDEGIIVDGIIVIISKIPSPYKPDLKNSGLINRKPAISMNTNISPLGVKKGDVINITGQAYFQEENIQEFKYINQEYRLSSEASNLINPMLKVKFIAPHNYRLVAQLQIYLLFFFIGVSFIYLIKDRGFFVKDKIDNLLGRRFIERYWFFNGILNYWVKTGIVMLSVFYFIKNLFINNVYIPYQELNANFTLLDFMTWIIIVVIYVIFFWSLDKIKQTLVSSQNKN